MYGGCNLFRRRATYPSVVSNFTLIRSSRCASALCGIIQPIPFVRNLPHPHPRGTPWWVRRFDCGRRHCAKNSGPAGHATPMASGNAPKTAGHGEEPTPPPPGMYWVQMQGLWALRPTADVDDRNAEAGTDRQRESQAGSTLEQQGALLTDADRQWLAQSAGAACSASALTEASALSEGAGSSRPEIQPRTQGVVEFNHQHCSPSFAAAVARDTAPLLQPHPSTPAPLPAPQPQPQDMPEQQHQGWPDWLLQWGRRVEEEEASHHAPGPSAPPSAPPSPPGTPQRSMVKVPVLGPCARPPLLRRTCSLRAVSVWAREKSPCRWVDEEWQPPRPGARPKSPIHCPRLRRPHHLCFYSLGQWGAQLPRPWAQLALVVLVLVIVFSLIDTIRRDEFSLNPGHPMLARSATCCMWRRARPFRLAQRTALLLLGQQLRDQGQPRAQRPGE